MRRTLGDDQGASAGAKEPGSEERVVADAGERALENTDGGPASGVPGEERFLALSGNASSEASLLGKQMEGSTTIMTPFP